MKLLDGTLGFPCSDMASEIFFAECRGCHWQAAGIARGETGRVSCTWMLTPTSLIMMRRSLQITYYILRDLI